MTLGVGVAAPMGVVGCPEREGREAASATCGACNAGFLPISSPK